MAAPMQRRFDAGSKPFQPRAGQQFDAPSGHRPVGGRILLYGVVSEGAFPCLGISCAVVEQHAIAIESDQRTCHETVRMNTSGYSPLHYRETRDTRDTLLGARVLDTRNSGT